MNIILEKGLPEELGGVPIFADFRNMIRFEQILQDESLNEAEKARFGLEQLFDELPPGGVEHAIELLMWFYAGGPEEEGAGTDGAVRKTERAYDLTKDSKYLYAAFMQAYGISLTTVEFLHWWEFLALLESLPEDTLMAQMMQWRTMDLGQIKDKGVRTHYAELKKRVALAPRAGRAQSVEEISRRNQERVARRFAEAEQRKNSAAAQRGDATGLPEAAAAQAGPEEGR